MRRQKVRNLQEARAFQASQLAVVTTPAVSTPVVSTPSVVNTPSPSPPASPYIPPAIPIRLTPAIDPLTLGLNSVMVTVQQQGAVLNNIQESEVRRASQDDTERKQLQESVSQIRTTLQTTLLQSMQQQNERAEREASDRKRMEESLAEAKATMESRLLQVISHQQGATEREAKLREERDNLIQQRDDLNHRLLMATQSFSPAPILTASSSQSSDSTLDSLQLLFSGTASSSSSSISHANIESAPGPLISPIHEEIKEDDWENVRSPGNTPATSPRRAAIRPTTNP